MNYTFAGWDLQKYVCEGYLKNAGLYSIISKITKSASVCPFKVYRIKDEKKHLRIKGWTGSNATGESIERALLLKELAYEEDTNHPLNALLEQPNPMQKQALFVQNSIGFRLLTGNKFWYKVVLDGGANAGKPVAVYNLPPQNMEIKVGGTMWEVSGYKLNLGTPVDIPAELILHSKYWNPEYDTSGGHLWGLSPLSAASRNLERSSKGEMRSLAMLTNAGAAGVLFNKQENSEMSVAQRSEARRKLNEEVLGLDNAGTIALSNGDLGYINFGMNAQDLSIVELEKWSFQQLCNVYGVPPGLFDPDKMSYNNSKEFKKELITAAVLPELAIERDDWNEIAKLYGDANLYVDYDISCYPEMQEDMQKTADIAGKAWWITGNEKRLMMGMDQDTVEPMMDKYLVSPNLVPLDELSMDSVNAAMDAVDNQDSQNTNG